MFGFHFPASGISVLDSNRFYVYVHRFANGTLYVGKGAAKRAWQSSLNRHNSYWDRLKIKHGSPRVRVLIAELAERDALASEMVVIARLRAKGKKLCNRTDGGDGCAGMFVSSKTRMKISEANSGAKNRMYGKTQPQHVRDAISAANKGRFVGEKSGMYNPETLSFFNDKTAESFTGTRWEMQNFSGLSAGWLSRICAGLCDSAKGWRLSTTNPDATGRRGKRHGRYDHTVFDFVHDSGIKESCTKNELGIKYNLPSPSNLTTLCAGRIKSYKGWRLPHKLKEMIVSTE